MPNARVKIYPAVGLYHTTVLNRPVYKDPSAKINLTSSIADTLSTNPDRPRNKLNIPRKDSLHRSKSRVREICLLNKFSYFVTMTLDDSKIDSLDYDHVRHSFEIWKRNLSVRYHVSGLFVPELGKLHNRLHFHGLVSSELPIVDSGHKLNDGRCVYNIPKWKYGFSTAIALVGDYSAVCNYIIKYISKDSTRIFPHSYSTCGNLIMYPETVTFDCDYDSFPAREYVIPNTAIKVKYKDEYVPSDTVLFGSDLSCDS